MLKKFSIFLFIFFTTVCAFAQTENYNAPVRWERYKNREKSVSVLFPKLPILISRTDICSQEETNRYIAYAENIVYGFNITVKSKPTIGSYCTNGKNSNLALYPCGQETGSSELPVRPSPAG